MLSDFYSDFKLIFELFPAEIANGFADSADFYFEITYLYHQELHARSLKVSRTNIVKYKWVQIFIRLQINFRDFVPQKSLMVSRITQIFILRLPICCIKNVV